MSRVYAYLIRHRKIAKDVLDAFVRKGMIYESADYHNAVFVGFDTNGVPRHAHKRGSGSESTYKGNADNSTPEYSFHWHGQSERLHLFEAPIDLLSYISMNKDGWWRHSYAACCGVADHVLWQMMKDNPNIKYVYLCLDNDEPGQQVAERIIGKLVEKESNRLKSSPQLSKTGMRIYFFTELGGRTMPNITALIVVATVVFACWAA